jgi:hypothetical protein
MDCGAVLAGVAVVENYVQNLDGVMTLRSATRGAVISIPDCTAFHFVEGLHKRDQKQHVKNEPQSPRPKLRAVSAVTSQNEKFRANGVSN